MKASTVIATYNRGYILGEALEGALQQTYSDFEIIVVDDGSTDDTEAVVSKFSAPQIRYIRHHTNRGVSAAYNTGISSAKGEFIGILDSDDVWRPNYLERQVQFLLKNADVSAVFTDTEITGEGLSLPSLTALMTEFPKLLSVGETQTEYCFGAREMYLCLLEEVPIKPSALLVRRNVFERLGYFDEAWPSGTDWEILLRFSRSERFGYIDLPLVLQRRTTDATHQLFREKDQLFLLDVFLKEKASLRNDPEALSAVNRAISSRCRNLGHYYIQSGQLKKALAIYRRGYGETRDPRLLLRALSGCVPAPVLQFLKNSMKTA